jgi:hypothetical protein
MGADITAFVEYWGWNTEPIWGQVKDPDLVLIAKPMISSISTGSFNIPGNYPLFFALSGLGTIEPPLHSARGLPPKISEEVGVHSLIAVVGDDTPMEQVNGRILRSHADDRVIRGLARYGGLEGGHHRSAITNDIGKYASWLLLREIHAALEFKGLSLKGQSPAFRAVIMAMQELETVIGKDHTRLVFWFDSDE